MNLNIGQTLILYIVEGHVDIERLQDWETEKRVTDGSAASVGEVAISYAQRQRGKIRQLGDAIANTCDTFVS